MKHQQQQGLSILDRIGDFLSKVNLCLQPELESQKLIEFQAQHNYLSLYKDPYYGQCHLVQSKRDRTKYVIIKENLSKQKHQAKISLIQQINLTSDGPSIQNILRASTLQDIQKTGFLFNKRELYLKYDYIIFDLEKQFQNRMTNNTEFSESQIKTIIRQCTQGFLRLQLNQYNSIRMKHIYFCNDGRDIKVAHPKMFNYKSNLQEIYQDYSKKNIYLSPQELYALKIGNNHFQCGWISNSFSFGMIILSLMTMKHLNDIYNYKDCHIDFQKIQQLINLSNNRYSFHLIAIVSELLRQKENQRLTCRNLFNRIDKHGRENAIQLTLIQDSEEPEIPYVEVIRPEKYEPKYPNYISALIKPKVGLYGQYMSLSNEQAHHSLNSQSVVANQRLRYSRNRNQDIGTYIGDTVNKEKGSSNEIIRQGKGVYQYKDGQTYLGDWKEGKMEGYGKLYYENKKIRYEGTFKNGLFHGNGVEYEQYQINEREDEIDEEYIKIYKGNWLKYEGYYVKDKKEGSGKMYFSKGFWRGNFKNNQPNGEGIFTSYSNNTSTKGVWKDGQLLKLL